MAQTGQIIPEYLHPHVKTIVNNNTVFQETTAAVVDGIRMLFVIMSGKGRDGVILPFDNTNDYKSEFGKPNFKLYGQPGYNAYAALSTGVVKAWILRIAAQNAAYANLLIVGKVKVIPAVTGATPAPAKLSVRFEAVHHTGVTDKNDLYELGLTTYDTDLDAEGYMTFPLIGYNAQGRGAYGNNLRSRIVTAAQADNENAYKNYRTEIYELEGTLNRVGSPFTGTVYPDALDGETSMFLQDIVADPDSGSTHVDMNVYSDSFAEIFELYKTQVDPTTTATIETFDLLYGSNKVDSTPLKIVYETSHADYVALDKVEAIPLSGGDDGDFTYSTNAAAAQARDEAITAAYVAAFAGTTDPAIKSKRLFPTDLILDAAYPQEAKAQLISLIQKRRDAAGYIDAGIISTLADALAFGEEMSAYGDYAFSKDFQHYKIKDPFSGKIIPVTVTFLMSMKLPLHMRNVGNYIPFVGRDYAALSGHIKGSLKPLVDFDDDENKEKLYVLRLNYFHTLAENTYVRGTQTTSDPVWSDLSEEHNVKVLFELKRKIEEMVASLAYNFAEQADRNRFTEDAGRIVEPLVGRKLRSGTVRFEMNQWEETRSILHCYLEIVYNTIAKRGIVEIDINPRA